MRVVKGQVERPYGDTINEAFLAFIGPMQGTVVDIGSGRGAWAPHLRRAGASRLLAVEPSDDARVAEGVYDAVFDGICEEVPAEFLSDASLLIAGDVLEHLLNPWAVLRSLRAGVAPGTQLAISVPNAQFARNLVPLLLRGQFTYSDNGGWFDRGHLRWFTRRTLTESLGEAGWSVVRSDGRLPGGVSKAIFKLTGGKARDLAFYQLHILAEAV
jgi:hypothetical protein